MDFFLILLGVVFIILGIAGCFVPVLPGPPLAYISLLLLQIGSETPFSWQFMLWMGGLVLAVTIVDYVVPALGAKKWGGSKYGVIGAFAGVVIGLFVMPPFGLIIFPFIGAFAGEIVAGAATNRAFKSAIGTLIGWIVGTMLKFSLTLVIAYYYFITL